MEAMFARREPGQIGDDFHLIARFGEGDGAFHLAAGSGFQDGDRFRRFIGKSGSGDQRKRSDREQTEHVSIECVCFHPANYSALRERKTRGAQSIIRCSMPA